MKNALRARIAAFGLTFVLACADGGQISQDSALDSTTTSSSPPSEGLTPQAIARTSMPSVVVVTAVDANNQPVALGSGFFVDDSTVATNHHVVSSARGVRVRLSHSDAEVSSTGLVAQRADRDLALLRVSLRGTPLPLNARTSRDIGEAVYAIGHPEGLEGTFSEGIVSGVRGLGSDTLIQITAPISPGSSGGPVMDSHGTVVGVATATFRNGQNLNFAVPASYVRELLSTQTQPVAFSSRVAREGSLAARFGDPSTSAVVAENFAWEGQFDFESDFTFSIRNRGDKPVSEVLVLVVFYDRRGNAIETSVVRAYRSILPGLAVRVSASVDKSIKQLTTNEIGYLRMSPRPNTKLEFRIISFKLGE